MKIASYQFKGSGDIGANVHAIHRGIGLAAQAGVRFLLTHECALCGYPPVEVGGVAAIDFALADAMVAEIGRLAGRHAMYIGLGCVRRCESEYFSSILLKGPDGRTVGSYDKRALWGWDLDHFTPGRQAGLFIMDGFRIGLRICYEVQFPEYFRELFRERVQIACVSFNHTSEKENQSRYEIIKANLVTRAVENTMVVVSANSMFRHQTAPSLIVDPDGHVLDIAPPDQETLIIHDFKGIEIDSRRAGRIKKSRELLAD
jgi:predicted amidohydrolase